VQPKPKERAAIGSLFAVATTVAHIVTSWRYGYFRDEFYFIACAKHFDWGYVDQPPLVAVAAWLAAPFQYNLVALRLLPAIAAGATVYFAVRIVKELDGGTFAQILAALATALLPAYLLLGNTLTTTSFEPLTWTWVLYLLIRMVRTRNERYLMAATLVFVFGMYAKYSMLLLACGVFAGLALTVQRRYLTGRAILAAVFLSATMLVPNIWWQWAHGWPFFEVVRGDFAHRHAFNTGLQLEYTNFAHNAVAFAVEQVVYVNPLALPIWLAGLLWAGFSYRFEQLRFIAIGYVVIFGLAVWLEAKGYYVIGIYAALLAIGSVAVEQELRNAPVRWTALAAFVVLTLPFVPLSLPVMPIQSFIAYTQTLHLTGQHRTRPRLIQPVYAEEFGWKELTARVASVYYSLPPSERARTGIFADTYADAGALQFYGPQYRLPPAISAQNTFYLWGTGGYDGQTLIVVGASQAGLVRKLYGTMTLAATYGNSYKWVVEGPTPIYICRDPIAPLRDLWPYLKWYGA
jgi:hypothetical protein